MVFEDNAVNIGLLALRIALGAVFIYHGFPKLKNPRAMATAFGNPNAVWFPAVLGFFETLSGVAVLLGLFTQLAAAVLALVMLGALYHKIVKWNIPFMAHDKTGWEFDLALLAIALALFFLGAGQISLDALLI